MSSTSTLTQYITAQSRSETPIAAQTADDLLERAEPTPPHLIIEELVEKLAEAEADRDRYKEDYEAACESFWKTYAAAMSVDIDSFTGVPLGTPWDAVADRVEGLSNELLSYAIRFARIRSLVDTDMFGDPE